MSPLAKRVIEELSNEEDNVVLAEVLDFYEFLKQKKVNEVRKVWDSIEADEPTIEETEIYKAYKNSEEDLIPLDDLVKELNLDGE